MVTERKYEIASLSEGELSIRLSKWFAKIEQGVYLFREGPTISQFDWNNDEARFAEAELAGLWLVRVFCREYELFARRLNYNVEQTWQVRIVAEPRLLTAEPRLLTEGNTATFIEDAATVLWGDATGSGNSFVTKPNRFRRAKLEYPGTESWSERERCKLLAERFQPAEGETIVCWTELKPAETTNHATQREQST